MSFSHNIWRSILCFLCASQLPCHAWWSTLYPENWTPPNQASFTLDPLIQDFSYAGYRHGEEPIPQIAGPIFDVVLNYGADPTGASDSTAAIQAAIDAAAAAGGGVVFLSAGTFLVAPQASNDFALRIQSSNIVLRGSGVGQTFIFNTSYEMRLKSVIRIAPTFTSLGPTVAITADLDTPTRRIPVANASAFQVGNVVRMEWTFTQEWIVDHHQGTWWSAPSTVPSPAQYLRQVTAVNSVDGWIEVDVPTRYTMKTRDTARVRTMSGHLSGVGIEGMSIGNVQHPGAGWAENDYINSLTAAYDVHGSWLISVQDAYDSWLTRVESYQASQNSSTCHMLSNGISLLRCFRVTLTDCAMRRSQYGGGGGNGYMYRVQSSQDNLIKDSIADFARHGIVISHAGTSGNVFLRCEDRQTGLSTGSSGSYTTGGSGSDNHMHFSHSNLWDQCRAFNSFFTAHHRGTSGTVPHALTSAHSVYWNTNGSGTGGDVVRSQQGRYGYVIGTSGTRTSVSNTTGGNTAPADHVEGIGIGSSLEPQSLYLDQFARRMQGIRISIDEGATVPPTSAYPLSATAYSYGGGPITYAWSQLSGPVAEIADATASATPVSILQGGVYVFQFTAQDGDKSATAQVTIIVDDSPVEPTVTPASLVSIDGVCGRTESEMVAPTGYFTPSTNATVGATGSSGSRNDWNVIYRYQLPTLPVGHTVSGCSFRFQISGFRDHSNNDYELDIYLLNTANPLSLGKTLFYHGANDSAHAFVGSHFETSGTNTSTITLSAPVDVTISVDTGAALTLLQSFYNGHVPNQAEASFRFNLDQLFSSLGGNALNRYILNHALAASGFKIESLPGPAVTYGTWVAGYLLGAYADFTDDPDDDGIPNGIEAYFGSHPGVFSRGLAVSATNGLVTTFNHSQSSNLPIDLSIRYVWSPNLIDWYPSGGGPANGSTVNMVKETAGPTTTITATASAAIPRIFLRAEVIKH